MKKLIKQADEGYPHRLVLYSVSARQRILENAELGCFEGEDNEEYGNRAKGDQSGFLRPVWGLFGVEEPQLVKVHDRGTDKENGNVEPIGRPADHAVIGVK